MDEEQTTTNTERAGLAKKLQAVSRACRHIGKDGHNRDQNYGYVSADAVAKAVGDACLEVGLLLSPDFEPLTAPQETYATKNGGLWRFCRVKCVLTVVDADTGARWVTVSYGDGTDPADKAILKAQTAAHRDALKKLFLITSKEDLEQDPEADGQTDREHPQQGRNSGHYAGRTDDRRQEQRQPAQREQRPDRGASTPRERDYGPQQQRGDERPQQISHGRPVEQQRGRQDEREQTQRQAPPQEREQLTGERAMYFRFGPCPQVAIGDMDDENLAKYLRVMRTELADPDKAKWRNQAEMRVRALTAEIALRKNGRAA